MNPFADEYVTCAEEGCDEKIKNHAWGKIKASEWFQQQDGTVWCPKHIPEWVEEWRKRKAAEKEALARGETPVPHYGKPRRKRKK